MHVVSLTAENFKRLTAVHIEPNGDPVVVVSGPNGAGKSSVLDAIWHAIGGAAAAKGTSQPIREGAERAEVTVDLGDLVVTRSWTNSGNTSLTVRDANGDRKRSPQALLDELCGRLTFDPLAFANASPRDQRDQLLALVDLPFDEAELAAQRKALYEERTEAGRWARRLTAQVDEYPDDPNAPTERVDVDAALAELAAARAAGAAVVEACERLGRQAETVGQLQARVETLVRQLEEAQAAHDNAVADYERLSDEVAALPEPPATEPIEQRIADATRINKAVDARDARAARVDEAEGAQSQVDDLTRRIEDLDRKKAEALAAVTMPIEGLGFTDDEVTYQGVPFAQASAAEKLRVSMAIAMAGNPGIQVAQIRDGSLLDSHGMALIAEMAEAHGMQVWVERVSDGDGAGVRIEDGAVVDG